MERPNLAITVSDTERAYLESVVRSRTLPHALVTRAKIVMYSADGVGSGERCEVSAPTISLWRKRFAESGLAGLRSEFRSGRPRSIDDETVLVGLMLPTPKLNLTFLCNFELSIVCHLLNKFNLFHSK